MIVSEEDYFEHHGVKGQRWGVRRQKIHDFGARHKKGLKIAGGVAAVATVAAGAFFIKKQMGKKGHIPASKMVVNTTSREVVTKEAATAMKGHSFIDTVVKAVEAKNSNNVSINFFGNNPNTTADNLNKPKVG